MKKASIVGLAVLFSVTSAFAQTRAPNGVDMGAQSGPPPVSAESVTYHGGPVLNQAVVSIDMWGNQAEFSPDLQAGMEAWLSGYQGSAYQSILGQYMPNGQAPTMAYNPNFVHDTSKPPLAPTDAQITREACKIAEQKRPANNRAALIDTVVDGNSAATASVAGAMGGVYAILSSTLPYPGYCGLHGSGKCGGQTIEWIYIANQVGDTGCNNISLYPGINDFTEDTDATVNLMAHELNETVTDPQGTAWYAGDGNEIMDNCVWTFNGPVQFGTYQFQVQEVWSNDAGGCVQGN